MSGEFSILANMDAFLVGMSSAVKKNNKTKDSMANILASTVKSLDEDFRSVYDKLIPNIHILDADYTSRLLLDKVVTNPEAFFTTRYSSTGAEAMSEATGLSSIVDEILTGAVKANITKKVVEAISKLHKGLLLKNGINPMYALNDAAEHIFNNIVDILNNPDSTEEEKTSAVTSAGRTFKIAINNIFGNRALVSCIDETLGSSPTRFIFFASSFNASKDKINSTISDAFVKALSESRNITNEFKVSSSIPVGDFINFAHSTIKDGTKSFLNSPSYAKLMYNVVHNPAGNKKSPFSEALRSSDYFKIKTGQLKAGLSVHKDFTGKTNSLLKFGITITTDDAADFNKAMGALESKYGSGIYSSAQAATKAMRESTSQRTLETIALKILGDNDVIQGTSSPSISNYILDSIGNALAGFTLKGTTHTTNKEVAVATKSTTSKKGKLNLPKPTKNTTSLAYTSTVKLRTPTGQFYSVTALQTLLNELLPKQIQKNMGKGDSKVLLNYRSGRLAESAQVERMSVSREGMISAFYSYMRNPYGTFSQGGQQNEPPSRDPKLLIAKSIREIAATKVANRMRAILV